LPGILIVYETTIREPKGFRFEPWMTGQMEKIQKGFDRLEQEVKKGRLRNLNPDEVAPSAFVAAASFVFLFDHLKIEWREGRPSFTKWQEAWQQRDSYQRTKDGDMNWATGQPYPPTFLVRNRSDAFL
jgi:glutathione S-transferase